MKIVTSGARYIDIDAYGGCIAYAELLQKQGIEARAVSEAIINQSVPALVREWPVELEVEYQPSSEDTFILVDVSEPEYFEKFVDTKRIDEVIDHHPGLEDYWQERIGNGAIIEQVGAACTQIFEKWEQASMVGQMSQTSAGLLMCGILDNTLNFGAEITTDRDRHAYDELTKIANLPEDWAARYFEACEADVVADLAQAVKDDTKTMSSFKSFNKPLAVGQLAIWSAPELVAESFNVFKTTLELDQPFWFMNLISIKDSRSYFVTDVPEVKAWLAELLAVEFDGDIAVADRMWLRKEIMKADIIKGSL